MTKQEVLTKILTNRINTMKVNKELDFSEIETTMNTFSAGGSITSEQYNALKTLIL